LALRHLHAEPTDIGSLVVPFRFLVLDHQRRSGPATELAAQRVRRPGADPRDHACRSVRLPQVCATVCAGSVMSKSKSDSAVSRQSIIGENVKKTVLLRHTHSFKEAFIA